MTNTQNRTTSGRAVEAGEALYAISALALRHSFEFSWWAMKSAYNSAYHAVWRDAPASEEMLHKDHEKNKERSLAEFHQKKNKGQLSLGGKTTSHLFRPRREETTKLESLGNFDKVLSIDTTNKIAHVGGMISFYDLAQETLKYGLLPKIVPELIKLTPGGVEAGMGIESSSFKYGLFHKIVTEMEILTGKGEIVTATKDNEYRDLFYGMPNSYGTLGYAVSLKIELMEAGPYVKLEHSQFHDLKSYFSAIESASHQTDKYNFIDGAIFSPDLMVMTTAKFVDEAPFTSNYRQKGVYYKSMQEKSGDFLTTSDYLWRWDADSFWSTEKPAILQNPYFRYLAGEVVLRSDRLKMFAKEAHEYHKNCLKLIGALCGNQTQKYQESIIQDLGIPIENCADFTKWMGENIGYPMWVCPTRDPVSEEKYPLWNFGEGKLICDIGFYGSKRTAIKHEKDHFTRQIEDKTVEAGGKQSLYAKVRLPAEKFRLYYYGDGAYEKLKEEYDPEGHFPTLLDKCTPGR